VAPKPKAEDLAREAATLDPKKLAEVEKAISQLSPEEAEHFIRLIERALTRRRIQFAGYMVSLVVLIGSMTGALIYAGAAPRGTFIGWVYFIPFLLVAALFWAFGAWANKYK
jgi:hypothetical protein